MKLAVGSGPWVTSCPDRVPGTVLGGEQTAPRTRQQLCGATDKYEMRTRHGPEEALPWGVSIPAEDDQQLKRRTRKSSLSHRGEPAPGRQA